MHKSILKIGHRGAMGHVAENTMESIQQALSFGVDGIEIDVHTCASGELMVFHDFTLDRITNGSGEIADYTLTDLKRLKILDVYQIPTLEEVLDVIDGRCIINIELKGLNTATNVVKIINKYIRFSNWNYDKFLVSSFQHKELESVCELDKNIHLAVLTKASIEEAISFAKTIGASAIHPNVALVSMDNVKRAQSFGYKINVWTANSESVIARMRYYGVDGIISDYPDRL